MSGQVYRGVSPRDRKGMTCMAGRVRNVYKGKVLKLNIERVKLPNGTVAELEIAHHPGGAVVVALDADERVCLLRQFRHAAGGWITELPAGKIDNREPPLECAKRELAEEAGVRARKWEPLGQLFSSPGVLTEVIHIFLARGLAVCDAGAEDHEVFETRWVPLAEAAALAADGRLQDAKTIAGLVWAQTRVQAEKRDDKQNRSKT
jgi:8-oxo-dGTP pyrophosphatase MutT (NUDIX family)